MEILTYTPFRTDLLLRVGINPKSALYQGIVEKIADQPDNVRVINATQSATYEYADLENDGYDLRLLVWRPPDQEKGAPDLRIHIYPNAVAIAEIRYHDVAPASSDALEEWVLKQSEAILTTAYEAFREFLNGLLQTIPDEYRVEIDTAGFMDEGKLDIDRISRAIILTEAERQDPAFHDLITDWLSDTIKSDDAALIIDGKLDHSMTWVNYAIVDTDERRTHTLISAMRIAQYFWSAQDWFNQETHEIVTDSLMEDNIWQAQKRLSDSRVRMQMLEIEHNALRAILNRQRERVLSEILALWGYDRLVKNGRLLGEIASQKIDEINERSASKRSLLTDMILGGIGFLAVIELLLYLHEFSREVMSRPALEYNDSHLSSILTFIAQIDTDRVLMSGFLLVGVLVLVYYFIRRGRRS